MNPDGSDVRRLTTSPATDRQPDWSPGGGAIAYSIRKPDSAINFEVARMTAAGTRPPRPHDDQDRAGIEPAVVVAERSLAPVSPQRPGCVSTIWQMGVLGERPALRFAPPYAPLYPSWSPDRRRVAFAGIVSPTGDTDRGVYTMNADGSGVTALFDVAGAYDSAPAWSPDGTQIAFESNADVAGANPDGDMELWVMAADGSRATQLTRNVSHDEGPALPPTAACSPIRAAPTTATARSTSWPPLAATCAG